MEHKAPNEFDTPLKKQKAIEQCVEDSCKPLKAKLALITDTKEFIWVNPQLRGTKSYSIILREDGYPLSAPFLRRTESERLQTLQLLAKLLGEITSTNSQIVKEALQNPSNLADRVWQTIWLASGENPDACLATFVETFVFKYLSDLGVLVTDEAGIGVTFSDALEKDTDKCLVFYFKTVRPYIKKLFPPNSIDGTSIINGTVLDPNIDEHNSLFHKILVEFERFGPLNRIDPEFKSRLYEHFLKKSISQANWGQFFTPRNIVKAMVEMSQMELLGDGAKVHDPACGVGGFLLEPMLNKRPRDYSVVSGKLKCKIEYTGFDRDPKTVILAKSNMLIHLNEFMGVNKVPANEFSRVFNSTFVSTHTSILGSLTRTEESVYDLILTNPPFVTTGTSKFKEFIKESGQLSSYYKINASGIEGLFVEKIVRSMKPGGKAIVIVPDGITNRSTDAKLRGFIRDECDIEAVISLPRGAFYTTNKKTYILVLVKKTDKDIVQEGPVFTYVVTQVGETLDANRFPCENDLPEMVRHFKYFQADKPNFQSTGMKCKLWPIDRFQAEDHWGVDRWWSTEERTALGIVEERSLVTISDFADRLETERARIQDAKNRLLALEEQIPKPEMTVEIELGDAQFFDLFIGDRVLRKQYHGKEKGDIPVWSADMESPFAWDHTTNIDNFDTESVLWGIDSNLFRFRVMPSGAKFRTTDHCGCARIIDEGIDASYLRHRLIAFAISSTLDRQLRPNLRTMKKVSIRFPVKVDKNGNPCMKQPNRESQDGPKRIFDLDIKEQRQIASFYDTFDEVKRELADHMKKLAELELEPLAW